MLLPAPFRRNRPGRGVSRSGTLLAVCGLAAIGLAAAPGGSPAQAASTGRPVARRAAAPPSPPAQRLPSSAQARKLPASVRQACPAPAEAGVMQCMALIRTNTPHHRGAVPDKTPNGYGASQLQNAYGLTSAAAKDGTGETVAVVDAFNDPDAQADLAVYRQQYGLPACDTSTGAGCITKVNEQGNPSPLPPSESDWAAEESVDLDMVSAVCPHCKILLVEASTASLTDLGAADDTAIKDGAAFVSDSWNGSEYPSESYYDNLYFNHPGVAIAVASGETGYGTTWPTSSQFVISVGGTSLTTDSSGSRGWSESVWNDSQGATGSGCAEADPKPAWQTGDDSSPNGCLNRTENDVAAVADPATGVASYDTYQSSGWSVVGGTSVATPIIASVYALAGTPTPGTYPGSYLYQSGHAADLNDVTTGSNGSCEPNRQYLCNAGNGYDGPTGLGTPDGTAAFTDSATGNTVTVIDPGTQDLEVNNPAFVAMQGEDSAGKSLTWSAKGLPAGLSMGSSTGRITGTPTTTGISTVTVTATDSTGAAGSLTFSIVILPSLTTSYHGVAGPVALDENSKCLDDHGDGSTNGTIIDSYECNQSAAQNWEFVPDGAPGGSGMFTIHSKCMDVVGGSTANQSKVDLNTCDGAASQQWLLDGSAGQIYNPNSGLCLADPGGSAKNGVQLWIATCNGKGNQAWIPPASPVQSGVSGHCLDDSGDGSANGTKIDIATCSGGASQKWTTEPDDTLRIQGKCLTVTGGSKLDGTLLELYTCASPANPDQQWLIGPSGELVNVHSGRCLDDPGNSKTGGTAQEQEDCYGHPGAIWAVS